jgi:hypothetical protein
MNLPLGLCRKYLDFHHLRSIFRVFNGKGITFLYTVVSHESTWQGVSIEDQLDYVFIEGKKLDTYRVMLMIHEEWFTRCENSESNQQKISKLNEEFNQFVLKILNEIRTVLTDVRTISDLGNVPALNSPPQPPSNSEMLELISERIQELTVHGGPKEVERENPWIHPTHGYLFG